MDKDVILERIRFVAAENGGRVPGKLAFQKATGIKEADWIGKYWAKWSDAVSEAGLSPNKMQSAFD